MMQSDVYLLIFFSHVRFRLTEVAKLDSQEVDDFLKANGLDYKPVCTINITHFLLINFNNLLISELDINNSLSHLRLKLSILHDHYASRWVLLFFYVLFFFVYRLKLQREKKRKTSWWMLASTSVLIKFWLLTISK